MIFEKDYMPQFREADADGLVGLRGYLNYFQDMATQFMYNLDKGNDVLPEKYGICWMYTKYKMHVEKKADFADLLHFETWMEGKKSPALVNQALVISRDGEIYARGRVESCLYDRNQNRLTRLSAVEFPDGVTEERTVELGAFTKIPKATDAEIKCMEYCYTHKVLYTDLDKSGHVTNLRYIDMLLNAFDSGFYSKNRVTDFEIHYLSQCFEGEEIQVYKKMADNGFYLAGIHANGEIAVQGLLQIQNGRDKAE